MRALRELGRRLAARLDAHRDGDITLSRLRRVCASAGFDLPRGTSVRMEGGVAEIFHPLAHARAAAWRDVDRDQINPALVEAARMVASKVATSVLHEKLARQLGDGMAPAWSRLVHPLALRLVLEDRPDRSAGPWDWQSGRGTGGRISDFHCKSTGYGTEEFTRIMLMRRSDAGRVEAVFTFLPDAQDGRQRAQIAITTVAPEAVASSAVGRRLQELVELAPTGHADIDAAVEALVIARAEPQQISTVITLQPTRWIPWDTPPREWRGWDDEVPYRA